MPDFSSASYNPPLTNFLKLNVLGMHMDVSMKIPEKL